MALELRIAMANTGQARLTDVSPDLIEPIWEYHHDVGKSITGGTVYICRVPAARS